jgi:hypothetical protein
VQLLEQLVADGHLTHADGKALIEAFLGCVNPQGAWK